VRTFAAGTGGSDATGYRYLHEGQDVTAACLPDLQCVLARAHDAGSVSLCLDGTLIPTDRVATRAERGHPLWHSGKHHAFGGNMDAVFDPTGFRRGSRMCARPDRRAYLLGLIPVSLVAVMAQAQFAAEFTAETAALSGITSVTLVVSDFLTLVAYVLTLSLTLVVPGFLTLVAYVFILRGCRCLNVRRGSELCRFGPRLRRFRGRSWPSVRRARLFFHTYHATVTVHGTVTNWVTPAMIS
jgi:hypothetical protein